MPPVLSDESDTNPTKNPRKGRRSTKKGDKPVNIVKKIKIPLLTVAINKTAELDILLSKNITNYQNKFTTNGIKIKTNDIDEFKKLALDEEKMELLSRLF